MIGVDPGDRRAGRRRARVRAKVIRSGREAGGSSAGCSRRSGRWSAFRSGGSGDGGRDLGCSAQRARSITRGTRIPDGCSCCCSLVGITSAWSMSRAGPLAAGARAHGPRHPVADWSVALPVWVALAMRRSVAGASGGLSLDAAAADRRRPASAAFRRAAARAVRACVGRGPRRRSDTVAPRTRLTCCASRRRCSAACRSSRPFYVYAGDPGRGGYCARAAVHRCRRGDASTRPAVTADRRLPPAVVAIAAGFTYAAPAYTSEAAAAAHHPRAAGAGCDARRRGKSARSSRDSTSRQAHRAGGRRRLRRRRPASPWGRLPHPFVFRTTAPSLGHAPLEVAEFTLQAGRRRHGADGHRRAPRAAAWPCRSCFRQACCRRGRSLPGVLRLGPWTATYIAPAAGRRHVARQLRRRRRARLDDIRGRRHGTPACPAAAGWQRLPAWLPQERAVWTASSTWVLDARCAPTDCAGAPVTLNYVTVTSFNVSGQL